MHCFSSSGRAQISSPSPVSPFLVTVAVGLPWQGLTLHGRVQTLVSLCLEQGLSVFLDLDDFEENRPFFLRPFLSVCLVLPSEVLSLERLTRASRKDVHEEVTASICDDNFGRLLKEPLPTFPTLKRPCVGFKLKADIFFSSLLPPPPPLHISLR